jgi:3-oxoacyl-[acyl-carrier-protein] synthase III
MSQTEENIHKLKYPGAVDADGHILESAKCWEEYCEAKYRANAIQMKEDKDGLEYLEVNGVPSRVNRGWRTQRPGRNHQRSPDDAIKMKGPELFKIAVRSMADVTLKVAERAGVRLEDIALIVPHQANIRILNAVADRLGIAQDKSGGNESSGSQSAIGRAHQAA